VQITLPEDNSQNISVGPAPQEYVEMLMHPAYQKSFLVSHAALASRFLVTSSDYVSRGLQTRATTFTQNTKPAEKPMTFKPSTREHIRRINKFSEGAAGLSSKTVGQIGKVAQNLGATLALKSRKAGQGGRGFDANGNPIADYKPGILNKSLMAFSTVADGIEQAGRNLLTSTSSAATTVVSHKWGADAGDLSQTLTGGFKNVALVYIDVTGVSRRAIIKSVAKGMVIGRVSDGRQVVVGGGDGGQVELKGIEDHSTEADGVSSEAEVRRMASKKS
jgi:spartin